jgi:hypothetical protein
LDPKSRSLAAHKKYIEILRKMTPEQRLAKAFELTELSKALFRQGLRRRFPEMQDDEFEKLYRKRLDLCHNRNW